MDSLKINKYLALVIGVLLMACTEIDEPEIPQRNPEPENVVLTLVDPNATPETKALYANLWKIQSEGFMFGHHDDLLYGREWYTDAGRSDTREVCGDYPAVYSVDFAEIMDDRHATADLNDDRKRTILEARTRGEVITACIHINNPLTGGDSWDNSNDTVVKEILTEGSATHEKYQLWLDRLAAFVSDLKDEQGQLIPILFRPYHEHTQEWSWWGSKCTTQDEFIRFWQYTVDYLVDIKGVHNLIFAISPQLDGMAPKERLLYRWPGDDYVDFIGMDSYHGTYTEALASNVKNLAALSKEKLKPCGVTETGVEGIRDNSGKEYANYWTQEILNPIIGKDISLVVMWRNKYDPNFQGHHYYGPWIKHASASDFVDFYESSFTIFSQDLPNMYAMPDAVEVK
ncbi:glycoside hydrolase family 26 protein [Marinoscillum furvescens]|uniref:Mannan endo-1,4-beta-mannosidase n=1 Tax=Marinoscillum furvescens DSM 4134 TaxID=1122208 RepID=A0A3D9KZ27_MARFU|nr:glycosyl hydrolase [Marinoscillum furvescens]RED95302.1 mannan endo-1,4-beta-mannosidase [Marinoscillum furvescens DSM 4134]